MHKKKQSKHTPVLTKKRNPVVAALLRNPKRNAGAHKVANKDEPLTMLDITEKE
jgi:hypothetical protein